MTEAVYAQLVEAARGARLLTYSEVASTAGMDMASPDDRVRLGKILCDISRREHAEGRPLLSVVVVRVSDHSPGAGFFKLARELGRFKNGTEAEFFAEESSRVFETWAKGSEPRDRVE